MPRGFTRRAWLAVSLLPMVLIAAFSGRAWAVAAVAAPLEAVGGNGATVVAIPGGTVTDLVISPGGVVFGSNPSRNEVEVLNLATIALEAPIPVGRNPHGLDLSPDGTTLYVADFDSGQISVVDVASRRELRRIDIPGPLLGVAVSQPVSVAVANDGKVLVSTATNGGGSLVLVDPVSGSMSVVARVWLSAVLTPSADRSHIGVLLGGMSPSEVYLYTAATATVSARTWLGPDVAAIALNSTGSQLLAGPYLLDDGMHLEGTIDPARGWALAFAGSGATAYAVEDDHVDVIDTSRQLETATLALPEPRAQYSEAVGVSPDGAALVVATRSGFSVVDLAAAQPDPTCTSAVTGTVPGPVVAQVCGGPLHSVVADQSGHVYASNPSRNEIEVLDLATGRLEAPIPVGSQPSALAVSADGSKLYVADNGSVQISVVDLAQRVETARINVVPNESVSPTVYSVAVANNDVALVSTTYWGYGATPAIYEVNLRNGSVTKRTDFYQSQAGSGAELASSGDHSKIVVEEYPFAVFLYDPATASFGVNKGPGEWLGGVALDRTGAQILVNALPSVPNPVTFDLDSNLKLVGAVPGAGLGVAISSDGGTAYRVQGGWVDAIDMNSKAVAGAIALPEPVGRGSGAAAISADGAQLAVLTQSGISVVPTAAAAQAAPVLTATPQPSAAVWDYPFIDRATLSGGASASGTITFSAWDASVGGGVCAGAPKFVSRRSVTGDGTYESDQFRPLMSGAYYWVAEYSGDLHNKAAGPTPCGGPTSKMWAGQPHLVLTVSADVAAGPFPLAVRYSYQVRNDGNDPLAHASVNDSGCGPVGFAVGTGGPSGNLLPGTTWSFTCSRTYTQPGAFYGAVTATATDIYSPTTTRDTGVSTVKATCSQTVTGLVTHDITVAPGATCFDGAEVVGSISVPAGRAVFVNRSAVAGYIKSDGATVFRMCGSYIAGSIAVQNGAGPTTVGDPSSGDCPGNTITASVVAAFNRGGVTFGGNQVNQSLVVWNSSGGAGTKINRNLVGAILWCAGNVPAPTNGSHPNTVNGSRIGQCGSPSF